MQEALRNKEFELGTIDTLLNWADIGTKAHASERLESLVRQMPLRRREGLVTALACLTMVEAAEATDIAKTTVVQQSSVATLVVVAAMAAAAGVLSVWLWRSLAGKRAAPHQATEGMSQVVTVTIAGSPASHEHQGHPDTAAEQAAGSTAPATEEAAAATGAGSTAPAREDPLAEVPRARRVAMQASGAGERLLMRFKRDELRQELRQRSMPTTGLKADLIRRLLQVERRPSTELLEDIEATSRRTGRSVTLRDILVPEAAAAWLAAGRRRRG